MSGWIERVVLEFPTDLSRLWIAVDPDDLLLDERILSSLRERGFEVLPFEDSVAFRVEYEERYRSAWDRGDTATASALILHLRGNNVDGLPWDYLRDGRRVSLSLATLFHRLSYGVVRHTGSEYHEALYEAQSKYASQPLGESATKDFVLTHIFRISPYLVSRPEDLWRELLRLHYRGDGMPTILANHIASVLRGSEVFVDLPLAELFSSKNFLVRVVQHAWERFLAEKGLKERRPSGSQPPIESNLVIPFEHPDVRSILHSMFLEGALQPLTIQGQLPPNLPEWVKVGVLEDPNALEQLVVDGAVKIALDLPGIDASHRDWAQFSRRLGEVIFRFHSLPAPRADVANDHVRKLQKDADEGLREWATRHYTDLPSLPAVRGPVMVHHVPRFLARRRSSGEARIALLVLDGLAMDQWVQIREFLARKAPTFVFEEDACFAWAPTLTSVSRQALFSGLRPRDFSNSIETTTQEAMLWTRFWGENGLRNGEVSFRKGLRRVEQINVLASTITDPATKALGLVIDVVDQLVHGAILGKRSVTGQIEEWCETGLLEQLLWLLVENDYHIYLTADHGNVEAVGIGRLEQGLASEVHGERVRVYRSESLLLSTPQNADAFRIAVAGTPDDFLPLYASGRGAFVQRDEKIVAHGGISVEELIVPFVRLTASPKA